MTPTVRLRQITFTKCNSDLLKTMECSCGIPRDEACAHRHYYKWQKYPRVVHVQQIVGKAHGSPHLMALVAARTCLFGKSTAKFRILSRVGACGVACRAIHETDSSDK